MDEIISIKTPVSVQSINRKRLRALEEKIYRNIKKPIVESVNSILKHNLLESPETFTVYPKFKLHWDYYTIHSDNIRYYLDDDNYRRHLIVKLFDSDGWEVISEKYNESLGEVEMTIEFRKKIRRPNRITKYFRKLYNKFMRRRLFKHPNKKRLRTCFKLHDRNGKEIFSHSSIMNTYSNTLEKYIIRQLNESVKYYNLGDFELSENYRYLNIDFTDKDISGVDFRGVHFGENTVFKNTLTHGCNFDESEFKCELPPIIKESA